MAYVKRSIPLKQNETKVRFSFADIKGVDFRSEDTGDRRTPMSVNMYKDKSGAWATHPGFRSVGSFEGMCHGMFCLKDDVLLHIGSSLYRWTNYPDAFFESDLEKLYDGIKDGLVKSAVFDEKLIFADGNTLLVFDGESVAPLKSLAFIPQVMMSKKPDASLGDAYQQRNMLTPYFTEGFVGDGSSKTYKLSVKDIDADAVFAWSESGDTKKEYTEGKDFTVNRSTGEVVFTSAPPACDIAGIENVFIKAAKTMDTHGVLDKCTEVIVFDSRLFLTGNKEKPNNIFWSGVGDMTYFGELMYSERAGGGDKCMTALQLLTDGSLLSVKTGGDGAVCVWRSLDTGIEALSETYTATVGSSTQGTMSPFSHKVFVDDNVFLSEQGLLALSRNLSISFDRSVEHRSSLVDAKLLKEDIAAAYMEEHSGHLYILFPSGHVYVADSAQKTTSVSQDTEYEWAYLEDIGVYKGQELSGEEYTGGEFSAAHFLKSMDEKHLYFGGDGYICLFNFDMLDDLPSRSRPYNFNGRAINEYVKTPFTWFSQLGRYKKLDRRYNALYLKADIATGAKVAWRTEKNYFDDTAEMEFYSACLDFRDFDFGELCFSTLEQRMFPLRKVKANRFLQLQLLIKSLGCNKHLAVNALSLEAKILNRRL